MRKKFVKPTPKEIEQYALSVDFNLDGEYFFDYYQSKGWMVGRSPMKDWQAAVRCWKQREISANRIQAKPKLLSLFGKTCSKDKCGLPAVYKSTSGAYDMYYCAEHMPEKVKEKYV